MSDVVGFAPALIPGESRRPTKGVYLANIPRVEMDDLVGIDDFLWDGSQPPEPRRAAWWLKLEQDWAPYNMRLSFYG